MKTILGLFALLCFSFSLPAQVNTWRTDGNNNTDSTAQLGTTDADPLSLVTHDSLRLYISPDGNLGVATDQPGERLDVAVGNLAVRSLSGHGTRVLMVDPNGVFVASELRGGAAVGCTPVVDAWGEPSDEPGLLQLCTNWHGLRIFTPSPGEYEFPVAYLKLDVRGPGRFTRTLYAPELESTMGTDLKLRTNRTDRFHIQNNGMVGVNCAPENNIAFRLEAPFHTAPGVMFLSQSIAPNSSGYNYNVKLKVDNAATKALAVENTSFVNAQNPNGTEVFLLWGDGSVETRKVKVQNMNWPDYVFEPGYHLLSLPETEAFIQSHGHLPGVPSAAEVQTNGLDLGDMEAVLLQKVEELTLQVIELQKQVEAMKAQNGATPK